MEVSQTPRKHTVEDVFSDFRGRRAGLLKALVVDVEKFIHQCDPEKENLCLYGLPNETWEVKLPDEEVPTELPEPVLGINFARDGMPQKGWIAMIAIHSDSWLLSVAFHFGARLKFGKNERNRLFQMINKLPTILEVIIGNAKQPRDQSANQNSGKSKSSGGRPLHSVSQTKASNISPPPREEVEEEDDEEVAFCGVCGDPYEEDEFWICCDSCEKWFHGYCVNVTPAKAKSIKDYECPECRKNKKIKVSR